VRKHREFESPQLERGSDFNKGVRRSFGEKDRLRRRGRRERGEIKE